jgi:hypothetical protein
VRENEVALHIRALQLIICLYQLGRYEAFEDANGAFEAFRMVLRGWPTREGEQCRWRVWLRSSCNGGVPAALGKVAQLASLE